MWNRFAWSMALRHLRHNVGQTLLTMGIVSVSVILIIMLSSLMGGMQQRIVAAVTDSIAHITIAPRERTLLAAWRLKHLQSKSKIYIGKSVQLSQRKRKIEDWSTWVPRLRNFDPNILAVSPTVQEQGILYRGAQPHGVIVNGVIPRELDRVISVQTKIVQGSFLTLSTRQIVIGKELADELSLQMRDKIRLVASSGNTATFTITGIYDSGMRRMDRQSVYVPLRDAQSLFGLSNAVSNISLKIKEIYQANALADRIATVVPYEVNSWMRDNQRMLTAMQSQTQTTNLILLLTTIASGFAIASILIMAVVSKLRELGILKAMGATRRQIIQIFTLQGTIMAFLGAILGTGGGILVLRYLANLLTRDTSGRASSLFAIELDPYSVLIAFFVAILVGFLAALYPAWRAARVNPIDVIRGL